MLRLDDPTDNHGVGWVRLTDDQLTSLIYIGLKLARKGPRRDLTNRNAIKADEAAKVIAKGLVERLRRYPVFGPARPSDGPTCGGSADRPEQGSFQGA